MRSDQRTIILVNIYNHWRGPSLDKRVPLGMLYLGGSLKRAGYEVRVHHILEGEIDAHLSRIKLDDALFVAVTSIMTGFSLRGAITFSQKLRSRRPRVPIVWGGAQPSSIPEICLKENYVDAVGIGEGEETIVEIAKAYQGEIEFSDIKGFAYKNAKNEIVMNEERDVIRDLDMVFPDYSLVPLEDYIFHGGQITGLAMSSRGCPYNCSFCYNNSFNHRRWRAHSEDFVVKNILELKKRYPFSRISFSDDNFMVNKERAFSILQKLHEAGIRTYSIDLRIKGLSEEDVKRLNEFKVISIFFGTESLNPNLLKLIQKEHTKEDVIDGLVRLDKYPNISAQSEILIGLPFETKEEMIQDIREGLELYKYHRNFSLYFGALFPLPRTRMFGYAKANGFDPSRLQEFAEIDLNNVWRICDRWLPWAKEKEKKKIFWTEKYSQLIQLNRTERKGLYLRFTRWVDLIQFSISKFRLVHQRFIGSGIDFFVFRNKVWVLTILMLLMTSIRKTIVEQLVVDKRINYRNFGYLPTRSIQDIRGKLFGHVNLLKRLQAKDVMVALGVGKDDLVLDLGCGAGYFTVEMAKLAQMTYGIDVTPYLQQIKIPSRLEGRLNFILARGEALPFCGKIFDKILASEILPMIPDPLRLFSEIKRVLKKDGRLVIVNGTGHPALKEAFEKKPWFFRWLGKMYPKRMPESYESYCSILQQNFGTAQKRFFEEADIRSLLERSAFHVEYFDYTPGHLAGAFFSWSQFLLYLRKGKAISQRAFILKYALLRLIRGLEKRRFLGGLLCVARNDKEI